MGNKNVVRAAVVQTCSAAYSLPDTLDKLDKFTREAARDGAQLAVFPEALSVSTSSTRIIDQTHQPVALVAIRSTAFLASQSGTVLLLDETSSFATITRR